MRGISASRNVNEEIILCVAAVVIVITQGMSTGFFLIQAIQPFLHLFYGFLLRQALHLCEVLVPAQFLHTDGAAASQPHKAEDRKQNQQQRNQKDHQEDLPSGPILGAHRRLDISLVLRERCGAFGADLPIRLNRRLAVWAGGAKFGAALGTDHIGFHDWGAALWASEVHVIPTNQKIHDEANESGGQGCDEGPENSIHIPLSGVTIDEKADDKRQKNDEDQYNHCRDSRNSTHAVLPPLRE